METEAVALILLAGGGFYFLFWGVYAIRYQRGYRRTWLSDKLLRQTPRPMEEGMLRTQGVLRLIYGVVMIGMALYLWRVGG